MSIDVATLWYRRSLHWAALLLLPLAGLFYGLVKLRYFLYQKKWLKSVKFPVPVIIVGNITVGGTGKTPFVIWLAEFLKAQGFRPGIVGRGVGGEKHFLPVTITSASDVHEVGDEAILLAKRSQCPVVICINRVLAVQTLLKEQGCNIVLADDGLQHYRLARDIEIALVDQVRGLGNGRLLPAGPLREPVSRLKTVDFVVHHGAKRQDTSLTMQLTGTTLVSLVNKDQRQPVSAFTHRPCHVFAAIGHPARFFNSLRQQGLQVIEHAFPDHYRFEGRDFSFDDGWPIIMTEKDAVKCEHFADERFWFLPVTAEVDSVFEEMLLEKITSVINRFSPCGRSDYVEKFIIGEKKC